MGIPSTVWESRFTVNPPPGDSREPRFTAICPSGYSQRLRFTVMCAIRCGKGVAIHRESQLRWILVGAIHR